MKKLFSLSLIIDLISASVRLSGVTDIEEGEDITEAAPFPPYFLRLLIIVAQDRRLFKAHASTRAKNFTTCSRSAHPTDPAYVPSVSSPLGCVLVPFLPFPFWRRRAFVSVLAVRRRWSSTRTPLTHSEISTVPILKGFYANYMSVRTKTRRAKRASFFG